MTIPVDLVENGDFVRLDMDIRGRRQTDQRNQYEDDPQRQRERAEVRPGSIDEQTEDARGYRRQHDVQNCNDNPKHRTLPGRQLLRPHHLTASSAVPSPNTSTETRSPAMGYWIGAMLPVVTSMPRRSGVPAAVSLSASQASAFSGLPIMSPPC